PTTPATTVPAKPAPLPAPKPAPVPATPAVPLVVGLVAMPATLTPAPDGSGATTTVSFTLSAGAQVTASVTGPSGGAPLMTLVAPRLPAGGHVFEWSLGALPNGRYKVAISATPTSGGAAVVQTADVTVDRTLASFLVSLPAFSPNGDGVNDTISLTFAT